MNPNEFNLVGDAEQTSPEMSSFQAAQEAIAAAAPNTDLEVPLALIDHAELFRTTQTPFHEIDACFVGHRASSYDEESGEFRPEITYLSVRGWYGLDVISERVITYIVEHDPLSDTPYRGMVLQDFCAEPELYPYSDPDGDMLGALSAFYRGLEHTDPAALSPTNLLIGTTGDMKRTSECRKASKTDLQSMQAIVAPLSKLFEEFPREDGD